MTPDQSGSAVGFPSPVRRVVASGLVGKSVRDLIADSSWEPAEGFDQLAPKISIALPTFRRGDNGLLRQCIESLLAQTFTSFELIIIDDASSDSTRAIIEEFIAKDARIATIRHAQNVGLPTVSCNEAILRARASSIAFAFDDNVFEPDALQVLWDYHQAHPEAQMIHGIARAPLVDGEPIMFGGGEFTMARLRIANIIPNGGVLIDRQVFETVGLYDPHISMIRIADWDLWLRIAPHFAIHRVDRVLVTELGLTQSDSLGNSQIFDASLTREWLSQRRNESLLPTSMLEYDVAAIPSGLSPLSRAKIASLARSRFPRTLTEPLPPELGYVLLICDNFGPEVESCFMSLRADLGEHFVTVGHEQLHHFRMYDLILGANCVVLAGTNELSRSLGHRLRDLGIPYYLFLTDDTVNGDIPASTLRDDSLLRHSEGVLVPSKIVLDRCVALDLHPAVHNIAPEEPSGSHQPGARLNDTMVELLLAQHRPRSLSELMFTMNNAIDLAPQVPAGYYTPSELAAELSRRFRRNPLTMVGSFLRNLRRARA